MGTKDRLINSLVYTLDTNAIIYYFKDDPTVTRLINEALRNKEPLYISTLTVTELFSHPNSTDREEARLIESLLRVVSLIPVEIQIARAAGTLRRAYGLKLPDSVIAATAIFSNTPLMTRNVRDFKKVPILRVEAI